MYTLTKRMRVLVSGQICLLYVFICYKQVHPFMAFIHPL